MTSAPLGPVSHDVSVDGLSVAAFELKRTKHQRGAEGTAGRQKSELIIRIAAIRSLKSSIIQLDLS